MTSTDGSQRDPVDPDFAALFRPDLEPEIPPAEPAAVVDYEAPPERLAEESVVEPAPPAAGPEPVADPVADTGRIFRSQGVVGRDDAVLALAPDRRLRTLERRYDDASAVAPPVVEGDEADPAGVHHVIPVVDESAPAEAPVTDQPRSRGRRARTITAGAVYIVVIGVTVLVGFLNALIADGDIGWPTGLALVASSVYAALTVRRQDDTAAIIIPPVAFLIAALTAGQVFIGSLEGSLLNRLVVVFFTLADNWVWIIGATVAALVIVLVRRRRG